MFSSPLMSCRFLRRRSPTPWSRSSNESRHGVFRSGGGRRFLRWPRLCRPCLGAVFDLAALVRGAKERTAKRDAVPNEYTRVTVSLSLLDERIRATQQSLIDLQLKSLPVQDGATIARFDLTLAAQMGSWLGQPE